MPRCSVVIPAYNVEAYLAEAVESALAQTYVDREVILVDDGSTDGTGDVASRYAGDVTILRNADRSGLSAARNLALDHAGGELVALLDGDDVWQAERLGRLVAHLDEHQDVGFVTSDAYFLNEQERSTERYYDRFALLLEGDPFGAGDQRYWILNHNFVFGMTVIRRRLLDAHGRFDTSLGTTEDWDLWMRFIHAGERAGRVPEPLAYYRIRSGSLTGDPAAARLNGLRVVHGAVERLGPHGLTGLGTPLLRRGRQAAALGLPAEAAFFFRAAARDDRLDLRRRAAAAVAATLPGPSWRLYRGWHGSRHAWRGRVRRIAGRGGAVGKLG